MGNNRIGKVGSSENPGAVQPHGPAAERSKFVYSKPITDIPSGVEPLLLATSYKITGEIEMPENGGNGMRVRRRLITPM